MINFPHCSHFWKLLSSFTQPNLLNAYVKDYLKSHSPVSHAVQKFGAMQDGLTPLCEKNVKCQGKLVRSRAFHNWFWSMKYQYSSHKFHSSSINAWIFMYHFGCVTFEDKWKTVAREQREDVSLNIYICTFSFYQIYHISSQMTRWNARPSETKTCLPYIINDERRKSFWWWALNILIASPGHQQLSWYGRRSFMILRH